MRIAVGSIALAAMLASCSSSTPFVLDETTATTAQYGTDVDDVLLWVSRTSSGAVGSGSTIGQLAAPPAGGKDAYVRFVDESGAIEKEEQFGVDGDDAALGNSAAPSDDVYVVGYTNGSLAGEHQGSADVWVRRYDADRSVSWTTQIGGPKWDRAYGAVADDEGVFVSGYTFGDLASEQMGEADAFVGRLDSSGNVTWLNQYGSDELDWGQGAAAAPDGGVYLVGFTEGEIAAPNAGERDAFVMHIGADGAVVGAAQFGTEGVDWATSAVSDDDGVVIVGHTAGALAGDHAGESDVFVIALAPDLSIRWTLQFGSDVQDQGYGIAATDNGFIVSGFTLGVLGAESFGDRDGFVADIGTDGVLRSIDQVGTAAIDETYGVTATDRGIWLVGYTTGEFASPPLGGTDIIELNYEQE
ncbi:MAG: hypothetical protein ACR2N2_11620 [Acidimicrobiia bacterium]